MNNSNHTFMGQTRFYVFFSCILFYKPQFHKYCTNIMTDQLNEQLKVSMHVTSLAIWMGCSKVKKLIFTIIYQIWWALSLRASLYLGWKTVCHRWCCCSLGPVSCLRYNANITASYMEKCFIKLVLWISTIKIVKFLSCPQEL